ncbi:prepilin-type N-terminal cleavage/methylation domain-containing protein, partial [Campylobacter concisus]
MKRAFTLLELVVVIVV